MRYKSRHRKNADGNKLGDYWQKVEQMLVALFRSIANCSGKKCLSHEEKHYDGEEHVDPICCSNRLVAHAFVALILTVFGITGSLRQIKWQPQELCEVHTEEFLPCQARRKKSLEGREDEEDNGACFP